MTKGPRDKKISGVRSTKQTKNVEETRGVQGSSGVQGTEGIGSVGGIKGASSVGSVAGAGRVRSSKGAGQVITTRQKEKLFAVIREEADKLTNDGIIPRGKKQIIESAVMMALETALVDDEEDGPSGASSPRGGSGPKR